MFRKKKEKYGCKRKGEGGMFWEDEEKEEEEEEMDDEEEMEDVGRDEVGGGRDKYKCQ